MTHPEILTIFKQLFPLFAGGVDEWFPNGKNSIRVRISEVDIDYVFTYNDILDWKFETINCFLKNLNKN